MRGSTLMSRLGGAPVRRVIARQAGQRLAARAAACALPLEVQLPDGQRLGFGAPPHVTVRVREGVALADLSLGGLAQAYVDGDLEVDGDPIEAIELLMQLDPGGGDPAARPPAPRAHHSRSRDRAAIHHHYDVGNGFYRLWLDERMVYSCAYYPTGRETLDEAQQAKLDHICRKLRLAPGERLLDVGCGWGALLVHACRHHGVRTVGVTLSQEQAAYARERIRAAGLAEVATVELADYRELPERFGRAAFDKVASVGMFEHVGLRNLPVYFGAIAAVLVDRGLFLNHGISSADVEHRPLGDGVAGFIERHVFPYGELPHLHLAVREMSAAGFEVVDVEGWRPHYARTLADWSRRLEARLEAAMREADPRTVRTWRAFLAGASTMFRLGRINVYQCLGSLQRTPGATALPPTRGWMYPAG